MNTLTLIAVMTTAAVVMQGVHAYMQKLLTSTLVQSCTVLGLITAGLALSSGSLDTTFAIELGFEAALGAYLGVLFRRYMLSMSTKMKKNEELMKKMRNLKD